MPGQQFLRFEYQGNNSFKVWVPGQQPFEGLGTRTTTLSRFRYQDDSFKIWVSGQFFYSLGHEKKILILSVLTLNYWLEVPIM